MTRRMKIVSVNVGLPRDIEWNGKTVRTSIFKTPVAGAVAVRRSNLAGDQQSDLTVHGGVDKAVYIYPAEHYAYWRAELPGADLPWGAFGENLSTEGLLEDDVYIGDRLRAGTAEFVVTQPRMPCYKLGIRFGRADMVKRFLRSGRTGFYVRVAREGEIAAGAVVELEAGERSVRVADIVGLYTADEVDLELMRRAASSPDLPEDWRETFRDRLGDSQG